MNFPSQDRIANRFKEIFGGVFTCDSLETTYGEIIEYHAVTTGLEDRELILHHLQSLVVMWNPRGQRDAARRQSMLYQKTIAKNKFTGLRFGHLVNRKPLFSAREEDLRVIPGISAKTAKKIFKHLELEIEKKLGSAQLIDKLQSLAIVSDSQAQQIGRCFKSDNRYSGELSAEFCSEVISSCIDKDGNATFEEVPNAFVRRLKDEIIEYRKKYGKYHWAFDPGLASYSKGKEIVERLDNEDSKGSSTIIVNGNYFGLLNRLTRKSERSVSIVLGNLNTKVHEVRTWLFQLAAVAKNGVVVRILLDSSTGPQSSQTEGELDSDLNVNVYRVESSMHSRYIVFDEEWALIGSHNCSAYSVHDSYEVSALTNVATIVGSLVAQSNTLFAESELQVENQ